MTVLAPDRHHVTFSQHLAPVAFQHTRPWPEVRTDIACGYKLFRRRGPLGPALCSGPPGRGRSAIERLSELEYRCVPLPRSAPR
jgi:hypothetical protein